MQDTQRVAIDERDEFSRLVDEACKGNLDAIERLVTKYETEVRSTARSLLSPSLRPYMDSQDLVQSVHQSLLRGLRKDQYSFSDPQQLSNLVQTIVKRKVARHWRKLRRQVRRESLPAVSSSATDNLLKQSSGEPDPSAKSQFADQLLHLFQMLDPMERKLVEMRLEGHSTAEVARKLNADPDVLRVRLHRLRLRLRDRGLLEKWV